jgi:hypothetical protein
VPALPGLEDHDPLPVDAALGTRLTGSARRSDEQGLTSGSDLDESGISG